MGSQLDEHVCVVYTTATILNWQNLLKPDKYKEIILESFKFLVQDRRAKIYGFAPIYRGA